MTIGEVADLKAVSVDTIRRWEKEGRMLAEICTDSHPHIVQVMDLFEDNNRHCLVMQYIPGMSLWDLVRQQGKLSETAAVKYIHQIGLALVEVHRRKLLHLDVTPLNIMINSESGTGKAVLIDFGIAADMSPPSTLSMSFGNRAFAPYELIRKGVRHPTVDVYCLAASLYYAVTGEIPTNSLARKWEEEELISPQQLFPTLSQPCCDAIMRGMALEAKERSQSIQEWIDLLIPQQTPVTAQAEVELKSDVGIDYSNLEKLLKAQNWLEADEETRRVMLKVTNREEKGWFDIGSINNFPCTDLHTIDQLWVKHSNGNFGFSVQKRIWLECGGKVDYKAEQALGDALGWRKNGKWLDYKDITYGKWLDYNDITLTLNAPLGHLPVWVWAEWGLSVYVVGSRGFLGVFFYRIQTCKM
ncbi:serine/threonine protein kinase [Brunnivagina elsteri CCALA 953]|uniref:Serine/threonine protein kinase n=1 Tax=Brunnivagina elsteri CCALA 953 TaxID=987040 RepID=A0A2A2TC80_9CYAN|nr:serine/threonine protein kinase [Calothrix elsteri CCALA 953]